jgi:integrase
MARPSKEYVTTTKTARVRLIARPKPYYRHVGPGKSLGYIRREPLPGSWIVREWNAGRYATRIVGSADDVARADGRDVLTFEQALRKATEPELPAPLRAGLTVADAIDRYVKALEARSEHALGTRQRADKHIIPVLGNIRIDRLSKTEIEQWLSGLVRDDPQDADARRRSQDSANRVLTILKASLNFAFADDANGIRSDTAWRRVKPFKNVAAARIDHFDAVAVRQLIAKAASFDQSFANLCEAAYLTGARLGELTALNVRDFDAAKNALFILKGKTGARVVSLSAESVRFFSKLAGAARPDAVLLPRADGERWAKNQQQRPFARAAAAAGLSSTSSFYSLRHSHVSRAIEAGMPLSVLAENCGTSLLMIQRNYAKVLAATRQEFVEATSPKLRRVK